MSSNFKLSFYSAFVNLNSAIISLDNLRESAINRYLLLQKLSNGLSIPMFPLDNSKDNEQHFCLKLIAAQSSWTTQYFIKNETLLFSLRLSELPQVEFDAFKAKLFFPFFHCNSDSKITRDSFYSPKERSNSKDTYRQIHFSKCVDVMANRDYQMVKGFLPVNDKTLKSLIVNEFRNYLEKTFDELRNKVIDINENRLIQMNTEIFNSHVKPVLLNTSTTTEDPNELENANYLPLCMKQLFHVLNTTKHLKNQDKLVIIRFLKDMNISVNDTIQYLSHKMPDFNKKELVYNIRYNYGLEGKKHEYGSYSCSKLISFKNSNAVSCPFVKDLNYVSKFVDIEDSGSPMSNCQRHLANLIDTECKSIDADDEKLRFNSPIEFIKRFLNEKNNSEKNK